MSSTSSNGIFGERLKTSARKSSSYGRYFAGQKAVKRGQGSNFFEDSQMQSIEHVGTLEFQYHRSTPWGLKPFFLRFPFWQGSKLVNWEKSILGWAQRLWNISHRAATKSACVSDQTNWFIFAKKCGPESQSTQAILKQIEHTYAQIKYALRVSLLHISATSKILHFRTCNCWIYIGLVFVLPNHSRGLTCLASVFHSKNRCAQICWNDASRTVAVQLMTSSREELVP